MSSFEIILKNGNKYILSLPNEMILERGKSYNYTLVLSVDNMITTGTTVEDVDSTLSAIDFSVTTGSATR